MGGETILPEGDAALIERCRRFDAAALERLGALDYDHPVARHFIETSLAGDENATNVIRELSISCAVRSERDRRRSETVSRWHEKHKKLVRSIYRTRLRCFANDIDDGVQEFWVQFVITAMDLTYNPERGSEDTFVRNRAFRDAFDFLRRLRNRAHHHGDIDVEAQPDGRPASPPDPFVNSPRTRLERRLHRLILTNKLQPHVAIPLIASDWAGIKIAEMTVRHLDSTLFDICRDLGKGPVRNRVVQDTFAMLRSQLKLPPESPLGDQTLRKLLGEAGRPFSELLPDWIEKGRRICRANLDVADDDASPHWVGPLEAAILRDLRARLEFALVRLKRGTESIIVLVWGWQKILDLRPHMFVGLRVDDAAVTLVRRMRWLLPDDPIPENFASLLTGGCTADTIRSILTGLGLDPEKVALSTERNFLTFRNERRPRL